MLTLSTYVSGFTLHTVIWFTLSKHMLGSKFSNFHRRFFHVYTLHTFRVHSPYSYLVYTPQTHVKFKIFKFPRQIKNFHVYTLHTFRVHSPYSYLVYNLQAHVRFKIFKFSQEIFFFFILTLSTHVSVFTLHTVIWFTLSKHMLGYQISNFHRSFSHFFHTYTLHTCFSMQLVLHSPSRCYIKKNRYFFSMFTLCTHVLVFTPQFAKQMFCLHSPSTY